MFGSSFIQPWFCQDWDHARWIRELKMLKSVGIMEIILQTTADTKIKRANYATALAGYTCYRTDMLKNAFMAAEVVGVKIRVGLGFSEDWWTPGVLSTSWLNREAAENILLVEEISALYGAHPFFAGWYIPHEFHQLMAGLRVFQYSLNHFFRQITGRIKLLSSMDVVIAPFYNSALSQQVPLNLWSQTLQRILGGTGIDIVALQDGIGVGYNNLDQLEFIYFHTQKALDSLGIQLFAVTETFTSLSDGNDPALQERINMQMMCVKPYVQGYVAFSIDHFQNGNVPEQASFYNDYLKYYLANRGVNE